MFTKCFLSIIAANLLGIVIGFACCVIIYENWRKKR